MANHKSALKRMRQNEKRRLRNKARKTRVKNLVKTVENALTTAKPQDIGHIKRQLRVAQKGIDKIASTGAIHWRKAARLISRLTKKTNALEKAAN
ncbi:MAG: 30S ribosomal protein S20 [Dissulfurimicrobium sp.]|uniref:30S ribosomal protein S20 n=1 Tax=Dissulfurimicrobium TaxID=1769732 RepID=UPI001EDA9486|nr:30S ribosomal protein S20 [Dissulfurimicrobium hydrothermale]UKL12850.1 30S ribosomal protein S20 [Dissulfurimicrobium hydrothermale]